MNRAIFYHASCFDGVASCVVAWDFLDHSGLGEVAALHPLGYEVRDRWLAEPLPPGAVVLDFLFHPTADFWADHHQTSFLTAESRSRFESGRRSLWFYDGRAPSCAGMLFRRLAEERAYRNAKLEPLVRYADKIDSADYATVEEAVMPQDPAAAISLSFAVRTDPEYSRRLVRLLRKEEGNVDAVAQDTAVHASIDEARQRVRSGIDRLRRARLPGYADMIIFDVEEGDALVSRYAPYLLAPNARYSVGIVRRPKEAKITTMRNPWRHFHGVNLGRICAEYGGGGHERVGSILLRGDSISRAREVLENVASDIQRLDS